MNTDMIKQEELLNVQQTESKAVWAVAPLLDVMNASPHPYFITITPLPPSAGTLHVTC